MFPDFYYINLERRPERNAHMLREFSKVKIPLNTVNRISARDGSSATTLQLTIDERRLFHHFHFLPNDKMTLYNFPRIAANFLSHLECLKMFLERSSKDYAVICQDDCSFSPSFLSDLLGLIQYLKVSKCKWSIIHFGFHRKAYYQTFDAFDFSSKEDSLFYETSSKKFSDEMTMDSNHCETNHEIICVENHGLRKLNKNMNPCSLCYLVSKESARLFLDYVYREGVKWPMDRVLNKFCIDHDQFYGPAKVMCTSCGVFQSDVWEHIVETPK